MTDTTCQLLTQPVPAGLAPLPAERQNELETALASQLGGPVPLPAALPAVFAASPFVAESAARQPALLGDLIARGELERPFAHAALAEQLAALRAAAEDDTALANALRQLRQREMLRIAWRDLCGRADLEETLTALTALADQCVATALDWLYSQLCARYGTPRDGAGNTVELVVLGLGKLGGGELNFSSDIDLIFAYAAEGETDGSRALDNQSFFVRLGQRLIAVLSEPTAAGFVFRVDMRLRPFGAAGPLAMSFEAMEHYFEVHGREWERYALLKARVIAGDHAAGERLLADLRPFIYRRYLDFGAFESLREMKLLINREAERKGVTGDIKLGAGGIREVEFIAQAFQLIRGGRDPELQTRSLRQALACLRVRQLLPDYAEAQLQAAYRFLRRVENRLQMVADRQTHCLPQEARERARLAFAMGYADWVSLHADLQQHMQQVHDQFEQVFVAPQADAGDSDTQIDQPLAQVWHGLLSDEAAKELLRDQGVADPGQALAWLQDLRNGRTGQSMSRNGRQRLDRLMPLLLGAVTGSHDPDTTLARLRKLLAAVARRSVYLALLVESPLALSQLVKLCAASPWIADYLARHPLLLDELLDARSLYAPLDRAALGAALQRELAAVASDDMDELMERLRHFKQTQLLRVAAADVMDVLPLMQVSDQLTWIAEAILAAVLEIAWQQMVARYGRPTCRVEGEPYYPGLAIIGYGKLGGIELGYGSDLDLVFLHDSHGEAQMTDGERSQDNVVFFARLSQRIIHILTAFTPAGTLYEVDTRLRPSGEAGLLVSDLAAFEAYQQRSAWTWEHQALVRARPVAGSATLHSAFAKMRHNILARPRDAQGLLEQVRDMRARMWAEHGREAAAAGFDPKRDPGGIADIEFMVQYLVLQHAAAQPSLTIYTDNIRLLDGLQACEVLSAVDAEALRQAYRALRDRVHAMALQERGKVLEIDAELATHRATVQQLWQRLLGVPAENQ